MTARRGRRLDFEHGLVELTHGGGGRATTQLIEELFLPAFHNDLLATRNDQAVMHMPACEMAMSTDCFVVSPLFFPGGDIGAMAVHGTVNDVAMSGAMPLYISAAFILEEGLPLHDLRRIVLSMAEAAQDAGVRIVTGDTKVVERGKGDGVFINTTGIGIRMPGVAPSVEKAQPGDAVIVSGTLGDHGIAILSQREGIGFETDVISDCASLHRMVASLIETCPHVRAMRDPTRGGLAATLNEIAEASGVGMILNESALPFDPQVEAACELLGLDPLHMANEGKLVAIVPFDAAEDVLEALHADPLGRRAALIGRVVEDPRHFVQIQGDFGGTRVLDWLAGEQLPRIC
ncbi:MAG: hydrogenase expression/formation protein HypE [Acetobacteraceae bacterium]|nr:hydrogenase expression/formation protein HypE [Acetobacteraceae bacterium]